MALSPLQLQTLKATIASDATLNALPNNSDGNFAIAEALNAPSSPAFIVWRSAVTVNEIMSNGFRWTDVDALTAAKYRTWECFMSLGTINPSRPNVRQGLRDCWGAGSPQEAAILPHLKRTATRTEAALAAGTGSDASPATMSFEGTLSYQDVEAARSS